MSSTAATPKVTAALELLDRAIELYLRRDSYYSALNLAGAAEEVLAVYVRELPADSSTTVGSASDQLKQLFVVISNQDEREASEKWFHDRTYDAKNSVKHKRGKRDNFVDFDPKSEAGDLIDLAVSTYFQLFSRTDIPYLPSVEAFDRERKIESAAAEA